MAETQTAVEPVARRSTMSALLVAGFVAVVVVAETAIFFFMVPNADDVAALAEARLIDRVEKRMHEDGDKRIESDQSIKEFPLGEYGVAFVPPGADRTYRVEFRLFGTVKGTDLTRMETLYAERQGRFHHRMMLEIRNATLEELSERQLGLLQRRILATSNEILDEDNPILVSIGFNDYQLMEE